LQVLTRCYFPAGRLDWTTYPEVFLVALA